MALRCMIICPDQEVSLKLEPQRFSPQANLVLIHQPTAVGTDGGLNTLPNPGIEVGPVVRKRDTLPLDH
ncbi:hypothetical protein TNCV_4602171 [Trichonephila clavipes]|nr:hypothetical protein TNCV_4602171 [Trichonephila clavipes]